MSTKTTFKRIALVAVASLGFGVLSSVAPASATAATGTVTPVSVSMTGANLDESPYAMVSWTTTSALTTNDTVTVSLTSAPSAAAMVRIIANTSIGATRGTSISDGAGTDSLAETTPQSIAATAFDAGATAAVGIQVDTAGFYAGTITTTTGGVTNNTVSFSFTTRGKAASFTTAVSAATVSPSGTSTLTVTLLDAAGNVTQPTMVDSFGITATSGAYAGSATALSIATAAAPAASNLYDGTAAIVYTAGSTADTAATLTVTPRGTLGALAAQTATVTTDATVVFTTTADADIAFTVTAPVDAAAVAGTVDGGDRAQSVRTGSSAITVGITNATASKTLRFKITASAGTVDGVAFTTPVYKNITTTSTGTGSVSFTLGGGALLNNATATVEQVDVVNASINPDGAGSTMDIVITQANAAVSAATLSMGIAGSIVRSLGTVTSVAVTVKDQFEGNLGAGWTIRAYRGSVSAANLLSTGQTDAAGLATVSVSPLATVVSGGSETYVYTADYPGVTQITTASESSKNLTVTYTTTGGITSLSTAISGTTGATTPVTDTTLASAVTIYPAIVVPTDGSANDAVGDSIYTVSTAAVTGTGTAEVITLASDATANNTSTYTATAGAFVSTTASTAWSAGLSTVTVAEGASVYVFATMTGLHTITVTSGGKTVLIKFWAYNLATDYYTVSAVADASTLKPSSNAVVTLTVKDIFGNVVDAADGLLTATAAGKVRLAGQALSQSLNTTAAGTSAFTIIGDSTAGEGTITIAPTSTGAQAWATAYVAPTGAAAPVKSATVTITVEGAPAKSAELLAIEAIAAKAAADKAESDAKIAALEAQIAANKATTDAAIAAAQAASVAAAEAAADAAAEAIDAGNNAFDAATSAGEAADAATAAAEQAGEDATAAATAAGEAAVAAAEAAQEAAAEATDAANAATDAANASAEAADAATAAAQDAADAVAALSTQVSEMITALKKQITALTNLVIKIQKKVKA